LKFFEHQLQARRASQRLLVLFALAVVVLMVCTLIGARLIWQVAMQGLPPPRFFDLTNALVMGGLVIGGAALELLRLKRGGAEIARMVGAQPITRTGALPGEQRLINIVEELAVASGMPVPALYVISEVGQINAFAAGTELRNACIVVTQGCLDHLTRDELQGVVAHEFSHIAHADILINMRLVAALYGLLLLRLLGERMLRPAGNPLSFFARSRGQPSLILAPAGALLWVAGTLGVWLGRLLRAAVSRHREYLADASAVRWTRIHHGLGGALRKILGQHAGRSAQAANPDLPANELLAHLYLSEPGQVGPPRWLATHPPLKDRIKRIYGRNMGPLACDSGPILPKPEPDLPAMAFASESDAHAQVAQAMQGHNAAVARPEAVPWLDDWRSQITTPQTAQRAVSALLGQTDAAHRLQKIELALPLLRCLDHEQRSLWLTALRSEALKDETLTHEEFVLLALLRAQLLRETGAMHTGRARLSQHRPAIKIIAASLVAHPGPMHDLQPFEQALEQLLELSALEKARLIKSLFQLTEQQPRAHSDELLHVIGALLDCPLPPRIHV
jgi:Zn-dependent protease with chaperone function